MKNETQSVAPHVDAWLARCVADATLSRCTPGLDLKLDLVIDQIPVRLQLADGRVTAERGDFSGTADIVVAANAAVWLRLLSAEEVSPGWHSFGAIMRLNPAFEVKGEPLAIAQALAALERIFLLAVPKVAEIRAPQVMRDPSVSIGRTQALTLQQEVPAELIYWEESGQGTPLLMLHTAGADSRQYRYQLWDVELSQQFHMYAFDMPGHGRSGMPSDHGDGASYRLTLENYVHACSAFLEQVIKAPAIVMGCSMGAAMSLVLAARRPDLVLGVLALEAPWQARGRTSPFLAHSRVNAGLHNAAYVSALLSPSSPARHRQESAWIYSQAGPGIYGGDLRFYSDEFDGEKVGQELSQTNVPIHLLTGDFDYSASPDDSARVAKLINGCVFRVMHGLGHFPMTEHPDYFRTLMLPELQQIRRRALASAPPGT